MAFKVKAFADVIAMTKEKLDASLAPIRARAAKARAQMAQAKLEERMLTLEREIHEACASTEINFDDVIAKIDQYDLAERKHTQIGKLIADLFPEK